MLWEGRICNLSLSGHLVIVEDLYMTDVRREHDTDRQAGSFFLVFFALLLFVAFPVGKARATGGKPLTLLYFGCQDGYLKPCG